MTTHTVKCEACGSAITGEICHLGFSEMDALYCSACPRVLLITDRNLPGHFGIKWPQHQAHDPGFRFYERHFLPVFEKIEALFQSCECGGYYGYMNPPRCPACNGLLRGNLYADKPVLKRNDGYAFVTVGSLDAIHHLKPEYARQYAPAGSPETAQS